MISSSPLKSHSNIESPQKSTPSTHLQSSLTSLSQKNQPSQNMGLSQKGLTPDGEEWVINWFLTQGIAAGNPEEILRKAQDQGKGAVLTMKKMGSDQSGLLERRLKKTLTIST